MSYITRHPSFASRSAARTVPERAVEIRVFWQDTLLDIVELSPPRPFYVGDVPRTDPDVDFTIPEAGVGRATLISVEEDDVYVVIPRRASASVRAKGAPRDRGAVIEGERVALKDGDTVDVRIANLVFSLRLAEREARCPRALLGEADSRPFAFLGGAFLLSSAFVSAMAYFTPPLGLTDDDELDRGRLYLMNAFLDASAERELERKQETADDPGNPGGADAPQEPAKGDSGKMGKREVTAQNRRASGTEAGPSPRAALSRVEQIALAQDFGMIGVLATGNKGATTAPWDDPGVGNLAVAGGMFGTEFGETSGMGGLGLLGQAEGGGGFSNQIGLVSIGTCQGEACTKGQGWGHGIARGGGGHEARAPRIAMNPPISSGSLPAEVIQRVVRQSFGRFRGCYEDGLRANPSLTGRVTARFVIARDGSVATVHSGGSDLPDARVVSCVLRAYSGLSFPAPKDGIVTVTYPISFSPSA